MKVQVNPVTFPTAYRIRRTLERRLQVTKLAVSARTTQALESWPALTNEFRAIDLIIRFAAPNINREEVRQGTPTIVDPTAVLEAIARAGATLGAVSDWAKFLFLQDRARLLGAATGEVDIATAAALAGVQPMISEADLKLDAVRELIMYSLKGVAPRRTQLAAAAIAMDLLTLDVKPPGPEAAPTAVAGFVAYIRLLEWTAQLLTQPQEGGTTFAVAIALKTEDAHKARVQSLSQLASLIAAVGKSGWLTAAVHMRTALTLPWVINAAFGRAADSVSAAVDEFDQRALVDSAFGTWSDLTGNIIDPVITGLADGLLAPSARAPYPTIGEPSHAGDLGNPLVGDLALVNNVPEAAVEILVDRFWLFVNGAEKAALHTAMPLSGEAPTYSTVPVPATDPAPSVEGGLVSAVTLVGYPLYDGHRDPERLWSSSRWSTRPLKLNYWRMYTRQAIVEAMISASSGFLPLTIVGTGTRREMALPTLVPLFGDLSDAHLQSAPSVDLLARTWGMTRAQLRTYIAALRPQAESFGMRRVAEALRFVGMLWTTDKGKRPAVLQEGAVTDPEEDSLHSVVLGTGTPVLPEERHWYHGLRHVACLGHNRVLWLGTAGANSGAVDVWLVPFSALPSTARWDQVWWNLALQPANSELVGHSIVRWVSSLDSHPLTPITGWQPPLNDAEPWDIIAVDIGDKEPRDLVIMGHDDKRPSALRHENAVMSLLPAGLPAPGFNVAPLPAPAVKVD